MHFCALRVVCPNCHTAFLVGGSTPNDLTRWWGSVVECRCCGAETSAAGGRMVEIRSAPAGPKIEAGSPEACHA